MPKAFHKLIVCVQCGKIELSYAHGLCQACYQAKYRQEHQAHLRIIIQEYRQRPEYKEQRTTYDVAYTLRHLND